MRICPHIRSQSAIEPVVFPTLLARRVGELVSLAASEIPPARRQVELRHAPRRSAPGPSRIRPASTLIDADEFW